MDVQSLVKKAGSVGKLADLLGVKHSTVCDWKRLGFVPGARVVQISDALAIPVADVSRLIKPADRREAV